MITTKISEEVYMIDTMALGQPNAVAAYVLKGRKTALVDCGYASSHTTVLEGLTELGIRPSEVDYIIPTHVHLDHAGGAGHLLAAMPKASIFAQEKGVPHLIDPTRLIESATQVFGAELVRLYGRPTPIVAERIEAVGKERFLDLGGLSINMIHSPGHAPHQLSVFVEQGKILLPADAVGILYPGVRTMIPTTPLPSLNPTELAKTTENLEQLDSRLLLVPHYGPRSDPKNVLEMTRKKTDEWVGRIRTMKNAGIKADDIVQTLMKEIGGEARIKERELPPYAQISIRISVNGIIHYLSKDA